MKASQKCYNLITSMEGFSAKPYKCPADIPTIGYGSTKYLNGTPVQMTDPAITQQQAELLLSQTLVEYEDAVNSLVKVKLTQNQFDALVDFAYNCGIGNLKKSTLLKLLNSGNYSGAANEFPKWNMGGGKVLQGLVKRRKLEQELFLSV